MMGYGAEHGKFDDVFSRVDTMHQRDRQTDRQTDRQRDGQMDRQTDTGRQQRPRLRIASRGKNFLTREIFT